MTKTKLQKDTGLHRKTKMPELLAPAGSSESFHAALEAGADAVYLGIDQINARLRAKNFTLQTLSFLVPYAHRTGVKVHVTLNTLIKQSEMRDALTVIQQLSEIGVDAIIIQDVGLAAAVSRHFPSVEVHGSTQMAIHNSSGAQAIQDLGLKRAILARELSFEEIQKIQQSTSLDLELFVHGALCYCFSGLCLASSYLGGMSGNRGRCTQVCRRRFFNAKQSGFFFSPRDFSALDYLKALIQMRIASFKIEGRMRSAEYVHTVVSTFRKFLDDPETLEDARDRLRYDFGREKTSLFLSGSQSPDVVTADKPSGTGLLLGTITGIRDTILRINTREPLLVGDRLRFHGQEGFEGKAARIQTIEYVNAGVAVTLKETLPVGTGDLVYLVSRKENKSSSWNRKKVPDSPARFSRSPNPPMHLFKKYEKSRFQGQPKPKAALTVRVDNPGWLYMLHKEDYQEVQFAGTLSEGRKLLQDKHLVNRWRGALSIVLPPYISEYDLPKWGELLKQFSLRGIDRGVAAQFGQIRLFPGNWKVIADYTIWATNRFSQHVLGEAGYHGFTYSPEDDFVNVRATAHAAGIVPMFGYIPLFVSRIAPAIEPGSLLRDQKQESFFVAKRGELFYLLGSKPLGLTHRRKLLSQAGISSYLFDFSFMPPNKKTAKGAIQSFHAMSKIPNTTVFNHKAGLK